MRYRSGPGKDKNHDDVVAAFKAVGCKVIDCHRFGSGFPDTLVYDRAGAYRFVEIKNPDTSYGRKGFNKRQQSFSDEGFTVWICRSAEEAAQMSELWLNTPGVLPHEFVSKLTAKRRPGRKPKTVEDAVSLT